MRAGHRSVRGQATVELALGSIVFITILLWGIHFAEAGWLRLKVQESATSALWEASGRRVQHLAPSFDTNTFVATLGPGGVADRALDRYRDFRGSVPVASAATYTAAVTRAQGLSVTCRANNTIGWAATATFTSVYQNRGGLDCSAEAMVRPIGIPSSFLQQNEGGFFAAANAPTTGIKFCAFGNRSGGTCDGVMPLLTNDWGLAGPLEGGDQPQPSIGCGAGAATYCGTVRSLWAGGGTRGEQFANTFAGTAPASAEEFNFAYAGYPNYLSPVANHGRAAVGPYNTGSPGIGLLAGMSAVPTRFYVP